MAIACVYCGGSHPRPGDVRECWERQRGGDASRVGVGVDRWEAEAPPATDGAAAATTVIDPEPTGSGGVSGSSSPQARASAGRPPPYEVPAPVGSLDVATSAGPDELGRHLIVADEQHVPAQWSDATRLLLDDAAVADAGSAIAELHAAGHARRRLVIVVPPGSAANRLLDGGSDERVDVAPHELGPQFTFPAEELARLATGNSIDARGPAGGRWLLLERAVALGARAAGTEERGDIVDADGQPLWLDGGSICHRAPIDGVPVVSAVAVEHGSLVPPRTNETSAALADDQLAAVTHPGGSARIIAPAGSGKTRVLTERARHLLTSWELPATAVSLVAFNKRAQTEMRQRTGDLPGLQVRTLNAIALAIINGTPPFAPQPFTWRTIAEPDVRRLIGGLVQFPRRRNADPIAPWIEALSAVRLGLRDPQRVEADYDGDVDGFAAVYSRYRAELERQRSVDFDDQIYRALEVLLTQPAARHAAQRASRLLLVDEFQDLTPAHVLLVRLLAGGGGNVFGVGDDDQTIYGYNGADPAWLIDFTTLVPGSGDHPLEVNYRCPSDVVAAADRLLRHNRRRVDKTIRAAPDAAADGLASVDGGDDVVAATVDVISGALDAGAEPPEIAVLTRVNSLLAPVQVALVSRGLPVNGGVGTELLGRTAVRAVLSWFRLALAGESGPLAAEDLSEALRRPSRPLHPRIGEWVAEQRDVRALRRLADRLTNERDAERVAGFADDIARLQAMAARGAETELLVRTLVDDLGLGGSVSSLDTNRQGMNRAAQSDDLVAVSQLARLHPDVATFEPWLATQLAVPRSDDGVVAATVHRVKGQQWRRVIVHCATADQFPHRLATDLEEERRLFHVAITRTSQRTTIVAGQRPSPFIAELHREPPEHGDDDAAGGAALLTPPADRRRGRPAAKAAADPLTDRETVLVAPGITLVDGGREWVVESVDGDGALARQGTATRRFGVGSKVVTPGRQRGTLMAGIADDGSEPASVVVYDELRVLRDRLRNGKPAYVVFDDKTLAGIARALPTTLDELARVHGVGPTKLEQYGTEVLGTVAAVVEGGA